MGQRFCRFIDTINEWTGKLVSPLFIALTLLVVMDVFTRYVLNNPWYYLDINVQIVGVLAALGGGYCYLYNGHISVDILVTGLSARKRAIVEAVLFPLFVGAIGTLLWKVAENTSRSVLTFEHTQSVLNLPIYPLKILVVVAIVLLLLQGVSKFISNLRIIFPAKSGGNP